MGGIGRTGGSSSAVLRQGPITGALLGADGIQLGVLVRVTLRDSQSLSVGQMDRSLLLGGVVCIGVFYALLTGDFVVILMSVVAGYVIHTLLG